MLWMSDIRRFDRSNKIRNSMKWRKRNERKNERKKWRKKKKKNLKSKKILMSKFEEEIIERKLYILLLFHIKYIFDSYKINFIIL